MDPEIWSTANLTLLGIVVSIIGSLFAKGIVSCTLPWANSVTLSDSIKAAAALFAGTQKAAYSLDFTFNLQVFTQRPREPL